MIRKIFRRIFKLFFTIKESLYSMHRQAERAGVNMGKNNQIFSHFWRPAEPYLITIGNNCQITKGVKFFTHGGSHVIRIIDPNFDVFGKIVVGDNVYIGNNSLIMPGVSIGNNVIIAAGSVITHSIPDDVVVGGGPAHILCTIKEYYYRNSPYNAGTKRLNNQEKKDYLIKLDDSKFVKKSTMVIAKNISKI